MCADNRDPLQKLLDDYSYAVWAVYKENSDEPATKGDIYEFAMQIHDLLESFRSRIASNSESLTSAETMLWEFREE